MGFFSSIWKGVKKVVKSPVGKIALAAAGAYFLAPAVLGATAAGTGAAAGSALSSSALSSSISASLFSGAVPPLQAATVGALSSSTAGMAAGAAGSAGLLSKGLELAKTAGNVSQVAGLFKGAGAGATAAPVPKMSISGDGGQEEALMKAEDEKRKRLLAVNARGLPGQLTPAGGVGGSASVARKMLLGQ